MKLLLLNFQAFILTKKLNFVNHITEMSMKVAKSLGLLYKLNRFVPQTILKTLYTSLIHPYLSYGIEAWYGTYPYNTYIKSSSSIGHRIESASARKVFYKSLTHRNAHEVSVFNLRILVSGLHVIAHVHERFDMYNKSILYVL